MSSTITNYSSLINTNFPVAGQDNDSQGFRSNFASIHSALSIASDEVSALQLNAVKLSATNDFGNNIIKRATLQNTNIVVNDVGSVSATVVNIDYSVGSYQTMAVAPGSHTFTIGNWPPAGNCGTIRVDMRPTSTATTTINFGSIDFISTGTILPKSYNQLSPIVWELWSPDAGTTVFVKEMNFYSYV